MIIPYLVKFGNLGLGTSDEASAKMKAWIPVLHQKHFRIGGLPCFSSSDEGSALLVKNNSDLVLGTRCTHAMSEGRLLSAFDTFRPDLSA